jgi:hypothetical protein
MQVGVSFTSEDKDDHPEEALVVVTKEVYYSASDVHPES